MATDKNRGERRREEYLGIASRRIGPRLRASLRRWAVAPFDALVSDRCLACRSRVARPRALVLRQPAGWCDACRERLVPYEAPFCLGVPACLGAGTCARRGHLRVHAAFAYGPEMAPVVRGAKYDDVPGWLDLWVRAWIASPVGRAAAAPDGERPEVLAPVPPHPARRRERGFDVTAEWARRLGALHGIPVAAALARVRQTPPQAGLDRGARARNLDGAFAPGREWRVLAGRRVALVDDVVTTGATAREAASVVVSAGAVRVGLWALAHEPLS